MVMKFKRLIVGSINVVTLVLLSMPALASTSGPSMPWDTPLQNVERALTGTVAHWIVIIAIALSGIGFAFGESGGGFRT